MSIPALSSDDVSAILTNWLNAEKRTLQEHQLMVLKDAFKQCPLPLFLKISYDETRLWRSYSTLNETCLEKTIRKAIDKLFERVEIGHGEVLVRRALGYLTAGRVLVWSSRLGNFVSSVKHGNSHNRQKGGKTNYIGLHRSYRKRRKTCIGRKRGKVCKHAASAGKHVADARARMDSCYNHTISLFFEPHKIANTVSLL